VRSERLKHLVDIRVSTVDKKSFDGQMPVALCNYTDVYYNDRITAELPFMMATATPEQVAKFTLRSGDVLITKDSETADDIAIPAFVPADLHGVLSGYHLAVLRPRKERVDGRYVYWALSTRQVRDHFSLAASGVTRFGLRHHAIGNATLPVRPIDEQRKIADYLDGETAEIDALIARREHQAELLQERKQSAIENAMREPPEGCERVPLMFLTEPSRPIMYGIVLPGPHFPGGVNLIKGGDVESGRLTPDRLSKTDPAIDSSHVRSRVRSGDIVYAIRGSYGAVATVPDELTGANITQDVARVSPRLSVNGRWLAYALSAPSATAQIGVRATGATIKGVNIRDLKRAVIEVPARDVQDKLVDRLDHQLTLIDDVVAHTRSQIVGLHERRGALIDAAVQGQLDMISTRLMH